MLDNRRVFCLKKFLFPNLSTVHRQTVRPDLERTAEAGLRESRWQHRSEGDPSLPGTLCGGQEQLPPACQGHRHLGPQECRTQVPG